MNNCTLLYFAQCGIGPLNQRVLRSTVSYEILEVTAGSAMLFTDDGEFRIGVHDLVLIPPDVRYRFMTDRKIEMTLIGFTGEYDLNESVKILRDCQNDKIGMILSVMASEFASCRHKRSAMLGALLNILLICILRTLRVCDCKKDFEKENLAYIMNFFNAHSHNLDDVVEISKLSGLSYHRFRHRFKEVSGISPQQYVIKQRLNFAKHLLEKTPYKTSLVAAACGFRSVPQFITCFSRQEGMTPVKYRKMFREKNARAEGRKS